MKNFTSLFSIISLSILLIACQGDATKIEKEYEIEVHDQLQTKDSTFSLIQLDSLQYAQHRGTIQSKPDQKKSITDIEQAQKILEGIVEFSAYENQSDKFVSSILFRNGKLYNYQDDPPFFIAYFPEEDILVCEGGHTSDILFNLTTGNDSIGNPTYTFSNKSKTLRLGTSYNGQSMEYFIEKKVENHFQRSIPLDDLVRDSLLLDILTIDEAIWLNDSTLILQSNNGYNFKSETDEQIFLKFTISNYSQTTKLN